MRWRSVLLYALAALFAYSCSMAVFWPRRLPRGRLPGGDTVSGGDEPSRSMYLSLAERFKKERGLLARQPSSASDEGSTMSWRTISLHEPRAFYVNAFWTDSEASWLLKEVSSRARMPSSANCGAGVYLGLPELQDSAIMKAARRRIALLTGLSVENIEPGQALRYTGGENYPAHPDYLSVMNKGDLVRGGDRVATVITWLQNTTSGGETTFPKSRNPSDGGKPYQVSPQSGNALVFWNCLKDCDEGAYCTGDPSSIHRAEPPGEGSSKWVAVFWVRQWAHG